MSSLNFTSRLVLDYIEYNGGELHKDDKSMNDLDIKESTLNNILNNLVKKGYLIQDPFDTNIFKWSGKIWNSINWVNNLKQENILKNFNIEKLKQDYKKLRDFEEKQKELGQKQIDAISKMMAAYKEWYENREEYEYYCEQIKCNYLFLS